MNFYLKFDFCLEHEEERIVLIFLENYIFEENASKSAVLNAVQSFNVSCLVWE